MAIQAGRTLHNAYDLGALAYLKALLLGSSFSLPQIPSKGLPLRQRRCRCEPSEAHDQYQDAYCVADGLLGVTRIGHMVLADIPLSAVDFHVSSIADELANDREVVAVLQVHFAVIQRFT